MSQIVPKEYITIDAALVELQESDVRTTDLRRRWEDTGCSLDGPDGDIFNDLCEQRALLFGFLHRVIRTQTIDVVALDRQWRELLLPNQYWTHPAGAASVRDGRVLADALPEADRLQFEGIPICFRRQQWVDFFARRTLAGDVAAFLAKQPKPKTTPAGYMRTSAALEDFFYSDKEWSQLRDKAEATLTESPNPELFVALEAARSALHIAFFAAVEGCALIPTVWDETSGQWREFATEYWGSSDGKNSLYRGELVGSVNVELVGAPVCFERTQWLAWHRNDKGPPPLQASDQVTRSAKARPRKGKPGAGNVPYVDGELVARARAGIATGEYKSPNAAAWALVDQIGGGGSDDSRVRRLATKIRDDIDANPTAESTKARPAK